MRRIISVLLNPYSLALWMTLLIMVFFPLRIAKYSSASIDNGIYINNPAVWYDDLDGEGNSERNLYDDKDHPNGTRVQISISGIT